MNFDRIFPNIQKINNKTICVKRANHFAIGALAEFLVALGFLIGKHEALGGAFVGVSLVFACKAYALRLRSRTLDNGLF